MPDSDASRPEKLQAALEVFNELLRLGPTDGGASFDDLCASRPDLTEELRKLRSVVQLGQAALASRSFKEILREEFGDLAELTVELAEERAHPLLRASPATHHSGTSPHDPRPASRVPRVPAEKFRGKTLLRASPATHHSETSPQNAEKFRQKTL